MLPETPPCASTRLRPYTLSRTLGASWRLRVRRLRASALTHPSGRLRSTAGALAVSCGRWVLHTMQQQSKHGCRHFLLRAPVRCFLGLHLSPIPALLVHTLVLTISVLNRLLLMPGWGCCTSSSPRVRGPPGSASRELLPLTPTSA